jgi:hypothetical protein
MQVKSYACDECGKAKAAVNHWMVVIAPRDRPEAMLIIPWDEQAAKERDAKHLCGQGCCHSLVDRFLTTGSLDVSKNEPSGHD